MITGRDGGANASTPAAHVAPLESRNTSRDPAALYAPASNSSVHSFSDSSSSLLLFVTFFCNRNCYGHTNRICIRPFLHTVLSHY